MPCGIASSPERGSFGKNGEIYLCSQNLALQERWQCVRTDGEGFAIRKIS